MVSLRDDVFIYTAGGGCATRKMKNAGKMPARRPRYSGDNHAHDDMGMAPMEHMPRNSNITLNMPPDFTSGATLHGFRNHIP